MKLTRRITLVATLTAGALVSNVAANAQPKDKVHGNPNDTYHLTFDNPKNGNETTWYSNSYASLYMIALMIIAEYHL